MKGQSFLLLDAPPFLAIGPLFVPAPTLSNVSCLHVGIHAVAGSLNSLDFPMFTNTYPFFISLGTHLRTDRTYVQNVPTGTFGAFLRARSVRTYVHVLYVPTYPFYVPARTFR